MSLLLLYFLVGKGEVGRTKERNPRTPAEFEMLQN